VQGVNVNSDKQSNIGPANHIRKAQTDKATIEKTLVVPSGNNGRPSSVGTGTVSPKKQRRKSIDDRAGQASTEARQVIPNQSIAYESEETHSRVAHFLTGG